MILSYLYWDPAREMLPFNLPILDRPILWYGFFFAFGFFIAYWIAIHMLKGEFGKKEARHIVDKMMLYIILGTIIGARLGDILFYQDISDYIHDPLAVFRVWEGGLASHGGVVGVIIGIFLCSRKLKISWIRLLDFIAIPTCIVASCIRIGNFFNQEILGKPSDLPWAVIFGHPADGGEIVPRHPAQMYEALFYFLLFFVLYFTRDHLKKRGRVAGTFLISVFTFRFFIEYFKMEQSVYLTGSASLFTMGQILSIPFILFGIYLCSKK